MRRLHTERDSHHQNELRPLEALSSAANPSASNAAADPRRTRRLASNEVIVSSSRVSVAIACTPIFVGSANDLRETLWL